MDYSSLFNEFLCADFGTKTKKHDFFDAILGYIASNSSHFFQIIFIARRKQLIEFKPGISSKNLAAIFEHKYYREIIGKPFEGSKKEYLLIEKVAARLYCNWLEFWSDFLIYEVKAKYRQHANLPQSPLLPLNDEIYSSELVNDISLDQRLFYTLHHKNPMLLKDAIYLINLELFVKEAKWYEMLLCTHLSRSGTHMILTTSLEYKYPIIVSSVLIQGWAQRHQWLSYHDYFQTDKWQLCLSNTGRATLNKSDIFSDDLKDTYTSVKGFEADFQSKLLKKNHICELLRRKRQ